MGAEFSSFRPTLMSRLLELGADPGLMKTCSIISGEGLPLVHVPMVALTEHISQTVTVKDRLSTALGLTFETTTAVPIPRSTATPAHTLAPRAVQPNPQPSVPQLPTASSQPAPALVASAPARAPSQATSVPSQGQPVSLHGQLTSSKSRPQPQPAPLQGHGQQQAFDSQFEDLQAEVPKPHVVTQLPAGKPTPASIIVLGSNTVAVLFRTSSPAVVLPGDVTLRPGEVVTYYPQVLSL